MTDLAAVVHTCEQSFTIQLKVDEIIRVGHNDPVLVYDLDGNKGELASICLYGPAIWSQDDLRRLLRSSNLFRQHYFAVFAGDSFQGAGLVRNAPKHMQIIAGLSLSTQ